jgi:DNA-binding GntR family transcriptional regulator
MLEPIHLLVAQSVEMSCPLTSYKRTVKHHERVLAAVRLGDAEAARQAMTLVLRAAAPVCCSRSVDGLPLEVVESKKHL